MPYISVVVPVYNRAELFRRTIENVLAQEFTDFEVIVVDDASTDDTVEVARRYCSDPRVRVEVNLENIGLTRNWNVGIGLATGELVQVMQSDDYMDADYLGRVAELFRREPTVGFVAANCRHIDGDDAVINPGMAAPPRHYRAGDEAVLAIVRGGYPHVSSQVIRRRCFEEVGAFNEELWFGPDVEMTCRLASHYDFHHFGGVHTSFRRHGTNSGVLEFLRRDYVPTFLKMLQLSRGYLTPAGLQELGIDDLHAHIGSEAAQLVLAGSTAMVAYDRSDLALYYLRQALALDRRAWRHSRFWKTSLLLLCPPIGSRVMRRRMGVSPADLAYAQRLQQALGARGLLLDVDVNPEG